MVERPTEDEVFERIVQMRAEQEASYCPICKGSGFDLENPKLCKNCNGTTKRGKGNCHKCIINGEASGLALDFCPRCHGPEYRFSITTAQPAPPPQRDHEHGGMRDVVCNPNRPTLRVLSSGE